MRVLLERNGFQNVQFTFRYNQSIYFDFFPAVCFDVGYDLLVSNLRIRNLACGILVTAERPWKD